MFARKKLGLLQPNLQGKLSYQSGKIVLVSPASRKRKNDENQTPVKSGRKDGIYEDLATPLTKKARQCPVSGVDAAVQTEQTQLTSSANCQAATINETSIAVASTSSNDCSGSLVSVSAPQIRELDAEAAIPIQNGKTVSMSTELEIPYEEGLPITSKATESKLKATLEVQQSVGEKDLTLTDAQADIDMLTSELPSQRYWEMMAAERKAALISTLAENRQLYQRNSELQERVHYLEHENTLLDDNLRVSKMMAEMLEAALKDQPKPEDSEQPPSGAAVDASPLSSSDEKQASLAEPLLASSEAV